MKKRIVYYVPLKVENSVCWKPFKTKRELLNYTSRFKHNIELEFNVTKDVATKSGVKSYKVRGFNDE